MSSIEFYSPSRMPPEFDRFEEPLTQLAVGTEGKLGALRARLRLRKDDSKTIIDDLYSKIPLQVLRALYIDESLPGMAFIYVMTPSGGVVQGDRLRMDLSLGKGTMTHITTQAATKIYRMNKNYGTQVVNIVVDEDAYLEFIPDFTIPYKDSRFYQEVNLQVHEDATAIYSEILAPGRVASGEILQFDTYYSKIVARNQDRGLRFIDTVVLEPRLFSLKALGILGTFGFVGNLYLLTRKVDAAELSNRLHVGLMEMGGGILGSSGPLAHGDGLIVRVLGSSSAAVKGALETCWDTIRKSILHAPAPKTRKY